MVAMIFANSSAEPFNVLIVGGGVAALEAALALRDLGGERITTTMVAPTPEFVYRSATAREAFGYAVARRYPLGEIARDIGVDLRVDSFKWLDRERGVVHTETGEQLSCGGGTGWPLGAAAAPRVWMTCAVAFVVAVPCALTGYVSQQNFDAQWISTQAKDGLNAAGVGAFLQRRELRPDVQLPRLPAAACGRRNRDRPRPARAQARHRAAFPAVRSGGTDRP